MKIGDCLGEGKRTMKKTMKSLIFFVLVSFSWTCFTTLFLIASDNDFNSAVTGTANSGAASPKELKQEALDALSPTGDKKAQRQLKKAIKHIQKSLEEKYWETDEILTKKGKKVFDEERKAAKELMKLLDKKGKKKKEKKEYQTIAAAAINNLLSADKALASLAIEQASNSSDPKAQKEISKAQKEMDKAQKETGKGHFDKAIEHYKKAWSHAQKAMKKALEEDVTPPEISVISPQDGDILGAIPTISLEYSDNVSGVDINTVILSLDGRASHLPQL